MISSFQIAHKRTQEGRGSRSRARSGDRCSRNVPAIVKDGTAPHSFKHLSTRWARRSESDPFAARKVIHLGALIVGLRSWSAPGFAGKDAQGGPGTCHSSQSVGGGPLSAA